MSLSVILAAAMALQAGTSVVLNWHAPAKSPEAVVGYNVYRQDGPSSGWVKINTSLVHTARYKDETVQRGHSYSYYIRSVDAKGNESAGSSPWTVKIPKKAKRNVKEAKQTSR
jgi:fibronectin type 3 domain-containing protein